MLKRIDHYLTFYMLFQRLPLNSLTFKWISFRRSRILTSSCQIFTRFSNSFKIINNLSMLKRIFLKASSLSSIKKNSSRMKMSMRWLLHQKQTSNLMTPKSVSAKKNITFRNAFTLWKTLDCQTKSQILLFRN